MRSIAVFSIFFSFHLNVSLLLCPLTRFNVRRVFFLSLPLPHNSMRWDAYWSKCLHLVWFFFFFSNINNNNKNRHFCWNIDFCKWKTFVSSRHNTSFSQLYYNLSPECVHPSKCRKISTITNIPHQQKGAAVRPAAECVWPLAIRPNSRELPLYLFENSGGALNSNNHSHAHIYTYIHLFTQTGCWQNLWWHNMLKTFPRDFV